MLITFLDPSLRARGLSKRITTLTVSIVVVLVMMAASAVSRASAQTPAPNWSISSVAEPTNFNAADTQDAVERFTVEATAGSYELVANTAEGFPTAPIAWNATAAEVQTAIEAVPQIKAVGNIELEAGVATATEHSYTVTWIGAQSGISPEGLKEESIYTEANLVNGSGSGKVDKKEVLQKEAVHDRYTVIATNVGSRPSTGVVTITDTLPSQLAQVRLLANINRVEELPSHQTHDCSLTPPVTFTCEYGEPVPPGAKLAVEVYVAVPSPLLTGPLVNEVTVSGGGAPASSSTSESTPVNTGPAPFGIDQFAFEPVGLAGGPDVQAGEHPYAVTTTLAFNTVFTGGTGPQGKFYDVQRDVKDVSVELPLGFVGDPLAAERCPEVDMTFQTGVAESGRTACPPGSIVGEVWLKTGGEGGASGGTEGGLPVYNIAPEHGYPAEFGFNYKGFSQPIFLYASVVPGESGYRLRVSTPGVLRARSIQVEGVALTVFGDPSAHNGGAAHSAFVTNPTACSTEPLETRAEATAWQGGSDAREATAYPQLSGCDLLQGIAAFNPEINVKPEETQVDTPSGYEVQLKLPQAPNVFGQLATPELKDASVSFPAGVALSPSVASGPNGLEGCTPAQIDLLGTELGEGHPGGNSSLYDDGLTHASPGHCPSGSQIGDVELKTPLLEEALHGHVYVAQPQCGGPGQPPCTEASASNGELFGIYFELSGSGVIVKLHGKVSADPRTGQLTSTFTDNPQLPFEELKLKLHGGQRAPLANPQTCGAYTTTTDLKPFSAPESGPDASPSSPFTVTGCVGPMAFAPGFQAGTVTPFAGGFSPFTMTLSHRDGEQDLAGVSLRMPAGVAGLISKVPLCGEPQASQGTCPEASRIGTTNVAAGAGSQPLSLSGPVYLTGPYKGAPFGLSIVVPAKAGPYNLGNEVVRAAISVDPHTAQVSVTSDPIPQIKDGVPFRLKTVNVTVDRPQFIFNPTNCAQLNVTGTLSGDLPNGAPGSTVGVSNPFAVTGCSNLPFKPSFTVSTQGSTSKANGASLTVKVAENPGEANIHRVNLQLPLILPARLTTLQKACTESQFAANPAGCPEASVIGTATAVTPVLGVPLTGPAYLVSHGGAAFPDVEFVLQGDGVMIVLDGTTDIKKGITYSRFETVPDAPISSFETVLPEGPHSALAANGNLCATTKTVSVRKRVTVRVHGHTKHVTKTVTQTVSQPLTIPTTITGQNGAVLTQATKVAVTGCPKAAVKKAAKKKTKHHKKAKGKKK